MVSKPLFWHFLSSLVFISVTHFSTLLPPSQQPPQPFAVEPPTSSSRRPWVLDLQPPLLRNFTLHRPLPFASPLQILLRSRFWRYHKDCLAPIYTLVKASTPSETVRSPTRHLKALFRWSCAPHASTWRCTSGFSLMRRCFRSRTSTLSLTSLLMSSTSALTCVVADVTCLHQPLMSSFDSKGLTVDYGRAVDFNRWLFSKVKFFNQGSSYPVFRVDFIFAVCFCILCL